MAENPQRKALPTDGNLRPLLGAIDLATGEIYPLEFNALTGGLKVEIVAGGSAGGGGKATDAYGFQAKAVTATYKYFYFEDASGNWYILRKTIATNVIAYTKGIGGYASVYGGPTSDPIGSPTFASYGVTF